MPKQSNRHSLTPTQQRKLTNLHRELGHWERQGVLSIGKLRAFIELAQAEGHSLRDIAGPAGNPKYNLLLQSLLDLGPGRAARRNQQAGADLVRSVPSPTNGRSRVVKLTPKGKRLRARLLAMRLNS